MQYQQLRKFISEEMRMSQVYQPVMLMQLLKNNGEATVQQIAQAILDKDPTQIEYFSEIVKNMVGRVLTKNRGITEKDGNTYKLIGSQDLSQQQVDELVSLCEQRIQDFERQRGEAEVNAINLLMAEQKKLLQEQDSTINGFNIGMNCGETAGQTIFHCHVHLIPRRKGDVENPRGGVRHIIAGKGFYEDKK